MGSEEAAAGGRGLLRAGEGWRDEREYAVRALVSLNA
jgi:hypothetical protein